MVIDITGYVGMWPYWKNSYVDSTGAGLVKLMDRANIDKSLVISLRSIFYDDREGNEDIFKAVEKYPDRLSPSITVSFKDQDNQSSYVEECLARGAKMIRLYPYYHNYKLSEENEELKRTMNLAASSNCPVNIAIRLLMNWGFWALEADAVVSFVKKFPETTFIIDAFNYPELYPLLELTRKYNNVYLATTCLTRYMALEEIVKSVGAKRLVCGTGGPLQIPECGVIKIKQAEIMDEDKEAILETNAKNLLNL